MTIEMTIDRAYNICNELANDLNCENDFDFADVLHKLAERENALAYLAKMNEIELDPRSVALLPRIAELLSATAELMNLSGKYDLWDIK